MEKRDKDITEGEEVLGYGVEEEKNMKKAIEKGMWKKPIQKKKTDLTETEMEMEEFELKKEGNKKWKKTREKQNPERDKDGI